MTYNDSIKRLVGEQNKLDKNIERLKTGEKSGSTDRVISEREDVFGQPYAAIGPHLVNYYNQIANGGFDIDLTGWTVESSTTAGVPDATCSIQDVTVQKGTGALKVTFPGVSLGQWFAITSDFIQAKATPYNFMIYALPGLSPHPFQVKMVATEYDDEDKPITSYIQFVSLEEMWQYTVRQFTPEANIVKVKLSILIDIVSGGFAGEVSCYFDSAELIDISDMDSPQMYVEMNKIKVLAEMTELDGHITSPDISYFPGEDLIPRAFPDGKLDAGWIPQLPHSGLSGLTTGNPHTQYPLYTNWASWTPTFTGFSSDPTDVVARYSIIGKVCFVSIFIGTAGTSNANTFTISAPVTAASVSGMVWYNSLGYYVDGGVITRGGGVVTISKGTGTLSLQTISGTTGWTTSGLKRAMFQLIYEVA
jgi:hypothetical protein